MGNKQPKLERKFSSLPAQSFPHAKNMNDPSFLRKLSKDAAKQRHNLSLERESYTQEGDIPFTDYMFLPNFSLQGDVSEESFDVIGVIAKGAFGDVLKVRKFEDQIDYAMKVMKKSQVLVDGAVQQCKDEASIHEYVGYHPFVVKAHSFFQSKENIFIVMDFIPRGELFGVWKRLDRFSTELVRIYVAELALVLDFLHDSKIVYRDMKMENILIDAQGHLKVTDFGLSKWLTKGEVTRTICGTLNYIAPEVLAMKPYGHAADWWSLGIVMYALLLGQFPVPQTNNHFEMAKQVEYHTYRVPQKHGISVEAIACGEQLLQKNPNERIQELKDLQEQAFFHDFNVEGIFSGHIRPIDYYESEDVFLYPVMANDPGRMQEFHGAKNKVNKMTRSQSADFLSDKSLLNTGKDQKPSYHGTFDCFDEPLPSPGNVNFGAIESDYLTNKAAQAMIKDHKLDASREPVENSCHGSSKTNSLKSNQELAGNRDSLHSNGSNQGGFPQYHSNRHSASSLDNNNKDKVTEAAKTWSKRNSGHQEGYGSNVKKPQAYKKGYSSPVEHSSVETEQRKSGQRDSTGGNNFSSGYQYKSHSSNDPADNLPTGQTQSKDVVSPTSRWPIGGSKMPPRNTSGYGNDTNVSPGALIVQDNSKQLAKGRNPARELDSINMKFQNKSLSPLGNSDQNSRLQSQKQQNSQPLTSQQSKSELPQYTGVHTNMTTTPTAIQQEFSTNPLQDIQGSGEFGPLTIQNPGYIARSSSASEGCNETESFIGYSDKPADPSSARFSVPISRNQWNPSAHDEASGSTVMTRSKSDHKLRQSTDTSGTEDSHSLDDVASSKRDSCGEGSVAHSIKDNKILYSDKTKPKRTKSQEHLPTWKRAKSPTESSEATVTLRPIIHVRNRSLDEAGRFSTMHKKKDSYRDAIFNQSKWLINLSMDAEAKYSLSKSSSKNSSTDNLLRRHSSEEDMLGRVDAQHHQGLPPRGRPSSENMTHHTRHSRSDHLDHAEVFEQEGKSNSPNVSSRPEFSRESNVRNSQKRSSGRSRQRYHRQQVSGEDVHGKGQQDSRSAQSFQNTRNQKQRSSGRKRKDDLNKHQTGILNTSQESIQHALVRNRSTGDFLETDIDEIMGLVPVGSTKKRKELAAQRTKSESHLLETDIDAVMEEEIQKERKPRKPVHKRESYRSAVNMYEVKQPQLKSHQPWGEKIVEASLDGSFEKHEPVKSKVKKKETASKKPNVETNVDTYQSSLKGEGLSSKGGRRGKKPKVISGSQIETKLMKHQDEFEYLESASRTRDSYYAAVNIGGDDKMSGRHDYVNADRYNDNMIQSSEQDMPLGMSANQQNYINNQRKEPTVVRQKPMSQSKGVVHDTNDTMPKASHNDKKVPSSISESQLHQYLKKPYQDQIAGTSSSGADVPPPKPPRSAEVFALQKSKSGPALNQMDKANFNPSDTVKSPEINITIHKRYETAGNKTEDNVSSNTQRNVATLKEKDNTNGSEFRVLRSYQNLQNPGSHKSRPWEIPRPVSRDIVKGHEPEPMTVQAKIQSLADLEKWNSPSVMTPIHKPDGTLPTSKSVGDILSYGEKEDKEISELASVHAKKKLFEQSETLFQPKKYDKNNTQIASPRLPISELTNSAQYNTASTKARTPMQSQSSSNLTNTPTSTALNHNAHFPLEEQLKHDVSSKSLVVIPKDRPTIAPKPKTQSGAPSPRGRIIPRSENTAPDSARSHNIPERMPIIRSKSSDDHFDPSVSTPSNRPFSSISSHEGRNFQDPKVPRNSQRSDFDLHRVVDTKEAQTVFKALPPEMPLNQQASVLSESSVWHTKDVSLSRKSSQASDISHSYINVGANVSSELVSNILAQELETLDKPRKATAILNANKELGSISSGTNNIKVGDLTAKPKPAPRPSTAGSASTSPRLRSAQYVNVNPIKLTDKVKLHDSLSQNALKMSQTPEQSSNQDTQYISPTSAMPTSSVTDHGIVRHSAPYYNLDFSSKVSVHSGDTGKSDGYMYPDPAMDLGHIPDIDQQNMPDYENMPRKLNSQFRGSAKNQSQGQISTGSSSSSDTFPRYMQMSPNAKSGGRTGHFPPQDTPLNRVSYPESHPDYVNVNPAGNNQNNQRPCLSPTHSDHTASSPHFPKQAFASGSTSSHTGHSRQNSKDSSRSHHSLHSPVPLNTGFMDISQHSRLASPRGLVKDAKPLQQPTPFSSSSPSPVLNSKSSVDAISAESQGNLNMPKNLPFQKQRWSDKVPAPNNSSAQVSNLSHSHMSFNDSGASSGDLSCGSFPEHSNTAFTSDVALNQSYATSSPSNVMHRQDSHNNVYNRQLNSPIYKPSDEPFTGGGNTTSNFHYSSGNWSSRQVKSPSGYSQSTDSSQFDDQQNASNRLVQDLSKPVPSPRSDVVQSGYPQRHSTHGVWGGENEADRQEEGVTVTRDRSKSQSGESQTDPDSSKDLSWSESVTSLSGMVV